VRFKFSDRGRLVLVALATALVLIAATLIAFVFVPSRFLDSIQGDPLDILDRTA